LKIKEAQKSFNEQVASARSLWRIANDGLVSIRKLKMHFDKEGTLGELEAIFKGNLKNFGFDSALLNSVVISRNSLKPEQEGYDIVSETSASDYIRVIWSYTLALLQLASKPEFTQVKHCGFVVFDEPRQHEASKVSFLSLVETAAATKKSGGQVIFATSLDKTDLIGACAGKEINLICFDDYILQMDQVE